MADYNKQTVAQLRQVLRDRGIASTGLTRKAQIVERLEEADRAGDDDGQDVAPAAQEAQGEDEGADTPGPALSEVGDARAQPDGSNALPLPIAPDQIKALERSGEDTTMDEEPGSIQTVGVFNAAPADPEDIVGPHMTEPTDAEVEGEGKNKLAQDELPDAPGSAAEALPYRQQIDQVTTETTSTPTATEEPSVEKVELLPIPERSTTETSRLPTEELEADTKKRKRRSNSPDVLAQDVKAKKPRPSEEPAPEIYLEEGNDEVAVEQRESEERFLKKKKADRYKALVDSSDDMTQEALQDDRPVAPALHPATSALYIRNFMRPLRPEPLRAHLVSLASPPSSSPDASIIKSLFLDTMKTHALVHFTSTTAASRVRASLHGSIWPPEGNRKELWVDFVPSDQVESWIQIEEDASTAEKEARQAGRPISAKRFQVVYPGNDKAVFQEVGATIAFDAHSTIPAAPTELLRQDIASSFKTLDQLFLSTSSTKPHLYYLPQSDDAADVRCRELDAETSRDWTPGEVRRGRGMKLEMKYKYSFNEDGRIVEVGEDRGPWAEDYRAER
ncbi:hypothetical protein ACEQ8H_007198, partial [Pleosporales sp. CAS-2024a]